jgi:hypothetical protein
MAIRKHQANIFGIIANVNGFELTHTVICRYVITKRDKAAQIMALKDVNGSRI